MKKSIKTAVFLSSIVLFQIQTGLSSGIQSYSHLKTMMDGQKMPKQVQGNSQEVALEALIESRYQSRKITETSSTGGYIGFSALPVPAGKMTSTWYEKERSEVRQEVYAEIEEGGLQYKSGFAHGWHMIAGTPVNYFRAILLAPLGIIFGIATGIAGTDGWL